MPTRRKSSKKRSVAEAVPSWCAFVLYPRFALPLLVVLVFLAYAGSLDGEFVFDDRLFIEHNTRLINIESLGDVLATGSIWRGLTGVSYGLNPTPSAKKSVWMGESIGSSASSMRKSRLSGQATTTMF